jgi:hypothetical protein
MVWLGIPLNAKGMDFTISVQNTFEVLILLMPPIVLANCCNHM